MQSGRLLIVATTPASKRIYEELFLPYCQKGLTVDFAWSGVAAIERLRNEPDPERRSNLLIIPAELPILSPHEFVRSVREDQNLKSIPIVIFTHGLNPEEVTHLYREGANTVIAIPLRFSEMEDIVKSFTQVWLSQAYLPFPGVCGEEAWKERP